MLALQPSEALDRLAKRYVWWESVLWAYQHADIFLASVMNLGAWNDIQALRRLVGDGALREILKQAPVGYFSYRSWDYWHVKLDMLPIPSLPQRLSKSIQQRLRQAARRVDAIPLIKEQGD